MKKERVITLTVSGSFGVGKSRLTYMLNKFLEENGFDVEQEYLPDHPTKENFNKVIGKDFDLAISSIRETRKIILKEQPTNRSGDVLEIR